MTARVEGRRVSVAVFDWTAGKAARKARPVAAAGAEVLWAAGDEAPGELRAWTPAGNTTRRAMRFVLPAEAGEPGTRVWVAARWLDRRLQPGVLGTPAGVVVGFEAGVCLPMLRAA